MAFISENLNISNFTSFGGSSKVQKVLSSKELKTFVDTNLHKRSGEKMSDIFSHLICKTVTRVDSIAKFKRIKDPIITPVSDRTTLGRQIDKFANISVPILKFFIPEKFLNSKELMIIIDSTMLRAEGKTYKGNKKLHDHNKGIYYDGYLVCTFILSDGKSFYPYKFIINDESKSSIMKILEEMRSLFNVNKVAFDAGFNGEEFFSELNRKGFLFYTKAVRAWIFNYGRNLKAEKHLAEMQDKKSYYEERDVYFKNLKLRFVSRKKDNRLILTNDFSCSKRKAFGKYIERWNVETFFKEAKGILMLNNFLRRKTYASIIAHITIVFASFSILMQLARKLNILKKGFELFIEEFICFKALAFKIKGKICLQVARLNKELLKFLRLRVNFYGGEI